MAPMADQEQIRAAERLAARANRPKKRRLRRPRCRALLRDMVALFPQARDLVLGSFVGAVAVALSNAVAIALVVPWPAGGVRVRLWHHVFDGVLLLGLGALLSLPAAAAALVPRAWRNWKSTALGWLGLSVLATLAMQWTLGTHLRRQAVSVLDGRAEALLYPLYLALCGLAIPAALLVGGLAGAHRYAALVPLALSVAGMVLGHAVLRDDYPGVHAAIFWTSACLFGLAVARRIRWRLGLDKRRYWPLVPAGFAVAALCWAPPNEVRLELFREPGAVASWVLARSLWSLPEVASPLPADMVPLLEPQPSQPSRGRYAPEPVVVLITVEALRADAVNSRAHDAEIPRLAWLRDHGASFERAVSPGSQTSVSLSTMFTGRYFSQLLWRRYGEGSSRFLYPAEDPSVRFPELLSAAGVDTRSYLGLKFLAARFGLARGFSHEHMAVAGRQHARAAELMGPLLARIDRIGKGHHFLYTHLMEPHAPYDRGVRQQGTDRARYISEVGEVDRWIQRLFVAMRRRLGKRGYLIITADHGEAFGEHGTRFHTKTLYDELLRVPLIIWGPGIAARTFDEPVSLVDLGPTILQLFGLEVPPGHMGQSLLPLIEGGVAGLERPVFAEGRLRRALYSRDGLKLIEDTRRKLVEAYDLERDPDELHNRFDPHAERVASRLAFMRAFFERHTRRDPPGYRPPYKR